MAKKQEFSYANLSTRIIISLLILVGLAIIASFTAGIISLFNGEMSPGGNTAIIPVEGVILASTGGGFVDGIISSDQLIEDITRAEEDANIEAVIFVINSPGGSAVASDEVAAAILAMEKPNVAVIREVGASGAYWIASATDHVIANRMSITGSIGVVGSYLSFGDFLEDWNITYNRLISGARKDTGNPFRELSIPERIYLQERMDKIHDFFIAAVAENRELEVATVEEIGDGSFYLGVEALELGLVDQLGTQEDALDWVNATIGSEATTVTYERERSIVDLLAGLQQRTIFPLALPEGVPMAR